MSTEKTLTTWTVDETAGHNPTDYLAKHAEEIMEVVVGSGAIRIRGLRSMRTAADFYAGVSQVLPNLRDYVGGTSPRETVYEKIMTATYTPPTWSIILHQEMAYTLTGPDYISFFCENPADNGGESTYGDMREALQRIDPQVRRRLERHGLQLYRALPAPDRVHLKPGVKKPWTEVFETDDRQRVAEIVAERGWTHEWMADGTLRLWQELVPAVREHPITGVPVWCNQAHFFPPICMMTWAQEDGRQADHEELAQAMADHPDLLDNIYLGNGEPVSSDDALHVYRVLRDIERDVLLDTGDLMLLDNLLVSHGRRHFTGDRRILVALADRAQ